MIPLVALWLSRFLPDPLERRATAASTRERFHRVFVVATVPALMAIPLIVPFRVPRDFVEVVILPVLVVWVGVSWAQAGAWRIESSDTRLVSARAPVLYPLGAVVLLLLIFQFVLRPGIAFF